MHRPVSCEINGFRLPKELTEHPLFLMVTTLKLAKQQGFQFRQQQGSDQRDLHMTHCAVLSLISKTGPMSQKDVAALLNADPSDVVNIIDKLESAGYLRRTRDEKDRRRHSLEITEEGSALVPRIQEQSRLFTEKFLAPLTPDERQQLQRLLLKVITHHTSRNAGK